MRKPRPHISAALAVAIEHQVGDIIRAARIRCRLHAHPAFIAAVAERGMDGEAGRPTAAPFGDLNRASTWAWRGDGARATRPPRGPPTTACVIPEPSVSREILASLSPVPCNLIG
jgi:hypothetical protein